MVVCYDNFSFKDTKPKETLGHTGGDFIHMTTASLVKCPDLPATGLLQSMHHPEKELDANEILLSGAVNGKDGGLAQKLSTAIIADVVKRGFQEAVASIFAGENHSKYPAMPVVDKIKENKTEYYQMGATRENEGSIDGTYRVHDKIFLSQLKLQAPKDPASDEPDDFRDRFWLVHGDQLTSQLIKSVIAE